MSQINIPTDREVAQRAHDLIILDLSDVYSLSSLASHCRVTPHSLKRVFKKIYGQSIADFSL